MPVLELLGTPPIVLVGAGERLEGEAWLSNTTSADVKVTQATLSVTFASGVEAGPIGLPSDAVVEASSTRRLVINMGMQPLTPPGTYEAALDLTTSEGSQSIPVAVIVASNLSPALVPPSQVFSGVAGGQALAGSVVVVNKGNVAIEVGQIGEEDVLRVQAIPRLFTIAASGAVVVQPATGLEPVGQATFTNDELSVEPGSSAKVDFALTTPEDLAANGHFRVLPRISIERFAIDLLT